MSKRMEFGAKFWKGDEGYKKSVVTGTYYCSGESEVKHQALCINVEGGQYVLDTRSIIKLLKKHGRI